MSGHLKHRTQTMGNKEGPTWTAYLKIILPLANILYEMREDEKHSCWMEIATQSLCCFIEKTKKIIIIQTHAECHLVAAEGCYGRAWNLPTGFTAFILRAQTIRKRKRVMTELLLGLWTEILPQHHTQTSGCPSCGDTWASEQARWAGTHPDRGHLSWFLYPPCMRIPGKKINNA